MTNYAVREFSHWEGARNPGRVVAVLATRAEAERLADRLSTCSFCSPGRAANYAVGRCFVVYPTRRLPAGYGLEQVDEAVLQDADIAYGEDS